MVIQNVFDRVVVPHCKKWYD